MSADEDVLREEIAWLRGLIETAMKACVSSHAREHSKALLALSIGYHERSRSGVPYVIDKTACARKSCAHPRFSHGPEHAVRGSKCVSHGCACVAFVHGNKAP